MTTPGCPPQLLHVAELGQVPDLRAGVLAGEMAVIRRGLRHAGRLADSMAASQCPAGSCRACEGRRLPQGRAGR